MQKTLFFVKLSVLQCQKYPKGLRKAIFPNWKQKQDGNVPSRRHILGSKIFKEQLLEKFFSKKLFLNFFSKKVFTYISTFKMSIYGWRLDAGMESSQVFGTWITILRLVLFSY